MSMNKVTRDGSFRGYATDWGVSLSSEKECPQWVLEIVLTEYWDEENEAWVDYTEMEEGITAYLTMVSGSGKVLKNCEQVMKVFDWDGMAWDVLAEGDYSDLQFQVRIKENDPEYADKNPYQVAWLDEYDAIPGGGVQKLDNAGLKKLNTKLSAIMKKKFGGVAAKSAPKSQPSNPKGKTAADTTTTPASGRALTAKEKMERNNAQSAKDAAAKEEKAANAARLKKEKAELAAKQKAKKDSEKEKPKASKMPSFKKPETKEEPDDDVEQSASMTQDEAWESIQDCQESLGSDCDSDTVNAALMSSIKEVGGSEAPDVDSFTGEQWAQVSELTIQALVGV